MTKCVLFNFVLVFFCCSESETKSAGFVHWMTVDGGAASHPEPFKSTLMSLTYYPVRSALLQISLPFITKKIRISGCQMWSLRHGQTGSSLQHRHLLCHQDVLQRVCRSYSGLTDWKIFINWWHSPCESLYISQQLHNPQYPVLIECIGHCCVSMWFPLHTLT